MNQNITKVYEVGKSSRGRPTITIRLKIIDIPEVLDRELMKISGYSFSNFDSQTTTYEFLTPTRLERAEKCLNKFMWLRID